MYLTGHAVQHATFGGGVITGMDDHVVTVNFSDGEKRFVYPDAFGRFLTLPDPQDKAQVRTLLHRRQQADQVETRKLLHELDRQQKIQNFKLTANSQAAFNLTPEQLSQLEQDWTLSSGTYASGASRGEPRVPDRMKPNSACILTLRPRGGTEAQRQVAGLCMVPRDFFGEDCTDGLIHAHPRYRLLLQPSEYLNFWSYMKAEGHKPCWGRTAFKYFGNKAVQAMLADLLRRSRGTEQEAPCRAFYEYFSQLNRLPVPTEMQD